MVQAPPTTPTAPELPVMCVSCGYALAGLAGDGVCPECATSVAQSVAARRSWFPSPRHLPVARRCLVVMLWCASLFPVVYVLGFLSPLVTGPGDRVLTSFGGICVALTWHIAMYMLAARDPTTPSGSARPLGNRLVLMCAVVALPIVIFRLAGFLGAPWNGYMRGGSLASVILNYLLTSAAPLMLVLLQIAAAARLLAKCETPRRRSARQRLQPDRPWLRRSAMLAIGLLAAQVLMTLWVWSGLSPNPLAAGRPLPPPRAIFNYRLLVWLALFAVCVALFVQVLAALAAANAGVRRALEDAQLQAVIDAELAAGRTL